MPYLHLCVPREIGFFDLGRDALHRRFCAYAICRLYTVYTVHLIHAMYYVILLHYVTCAWYKIKCISHLRAAAPRRYFDRVGGVFCARAGENVFGTGEPSNRRLGNVPPGRRGQVDMQRGRSVVHAHLCLRCCSAHTCAPVGANTFLSTASPRSPPDYR